MLPGGPDAPAVLPSNHSNIQPGAVLVTSSCQHCLVPGNVFFDSFSQEISLRHVQSKRVKPPLTHLSFGLVLSLPEKCLAQLYPGLKLTYMFLRTCIFLLIKNDFLILATHFKCTHKVSLIGRQIEVWIIDG